MIILTIFTMQIGFLFLVDSIVKSLELTIHK